MVVCFKSRKSFDLMSVESSIEQDSMYCQNRLNERYAGSGPCTQTMSVPLLKVKKHISLHTNLIDTGFYSKNLIVYKDLLSKQSIKAATQKVGFRSLFPNGLKKPNGCGGFSPRSWECWGRGRGWATDEATTPREDPIFFVRSATFWSYKMRWRLCQWATIYRAPDWLGYPPGN